MASKNCPINKIDSNITGLRIAEEECLGTLPENVDWILQDPNSYSDFGSELSTVARTPINPSRQRKKGTVTDLDASGGYNQDLTMDNFTWLLQGFMFADAHEKLTTAPLNTAKLPITQVIAAESTYVVNGFNTVKPNSLILASGFANSVNNGRKTVNEVELDRFSIVEGGLKDETIDPLTSKAKLQVVGYEFTTSLSIDVSYGLPRLIISSTSPVSSSQLGVIASEWILLNGEGTANRFQNNVGFARINSIGTLPNGDTYLEFDKTSWQPVNEASGGGHIQIFFGTFIQNEATPDLIIKRSYQLERTLGMDANGVQSEYLIGAVPNELTINIPQADKINCDLAFIATDNEQRTGLQGLKAGTRNQSPYDQEAINTSSDIARISLVQIDPATSIPKPLFAYSTELTLTINNNVSPNKAIGTLGAIDTTVGTFEVGGSLTAYFSTVEAVQAVRNNADVSIDVIIEKKNKALIWDIPLLSLGNGRLNVELDTPITVPLDMLAAQSSHNNTFLYMEFPYTPS